MKFVCGTPEENSFVIFSYVMLILHSNVILSLKLVLRRNANVYVKLCI